MKTRILEKYILIYIDSYYKTLGSIIFSASNFSEAYAYASRWCKLSTNTLLSVSKHVYSNEISYILSNSLK